MKVPVHTKSSDATIALFTQQPKVCVSGNQLKSLSNKPNFARQLRPTTQMRAKPADIKMSAVEAPPKNSTPLIDVGKYVKMTPPAPQQLERSVFNLFEKPEI